MTNNSPYSAPTPSTDILDAEMPISPELEETDRQQLFDENAYRETHSGFFADGDYSEIESAFLTGFNR